MRIELCSNFLAPVGVPRSRLEREWADQFHSINRFTQGEMELGTYSINPGNRNSQAGGCCPRRYEREEMRVYAVAYVAVTPEQRMGFFVPLVEVNTLLLRYDKRRWGEWRGREQSVRILLWIRGRVGEETTLLIGRRAFSYHVRHVSYPIPLFDCAGVPEWQQ